MAFKVYTTALHVAYSACKSNDAGSIPVSRQVIFELRCSLISLAVRLGRCVMCVWVQEGKASWRMAERDEKTIFFAL